MKQIDIYVKHLYLWAVVQKDGEIRDIKYRKHRGEIQAGLESITSLSAYKNYHT